MKVRLAALVMLLSLTMPSPPAAVVQQAKKVWRIGVVAFGPPTPAIDAALAAFVSGLTEHGHAVTIEYRWPEPDPLIRFSEEIVALRLDVLVFWGERALLTIPNRSELLSPPPAVFALYNELRPRDLMFHFSTDKGIAGVTATTPALLTDQVGIIKEVLPGISRLAILWDQSDAGSARAFSEAFAAADAAGLRPLGIEARTARQLEPAFAAAVAGERTRWSSSQVPPASAMRARWLPSPRATVFLRSIRSTSSPGGLVSYGASFGKTVRRAAMYVDRIIKGADWPPITTRGTLPIEPPRRLELVINLKTAKALGLTIPPSLLLRADHVIE